MHRFASRAIVILLLLAAVPGNPALAQTEVELPLVRALDEQGRAQALIVLEPVADRAALDRMKDEILAALPPGTFRLGYRYAVLPLLAGEVTATAVRALMLDGRVRSVGLDEPIEAVLGESAVVVGAPAVHARSFTGKGVTVAVIDSGIDTNHADLSDNLAPGAWHFLGGGTNTGAGAEDDFGHGTQVAGVITSGGHVAPLGIAPDADILALKVLDQNGSGWTSDQVAAIDHVVANRTNWPNLAAINISLGTNSKYAACPCDTLNSTTQSLATAVNAARAAGIPVFAAAGNGGSTSSMPAPACLQNAVAVGATYDNAFTTVQWTNCTDTNPQKDQLVCITDRMVGCLDLVAPGALLDLPAMGGGMTSLAGGTSFATPHAAAAAALLRQAMPCLAPAALENALLTSGPSIPDPTLSAFYPRLDISAALDTLPRIEPLDPPRIGWRVRLRLQAPASSLLGYAAAASLATAPKLPLGGGKCIALAFDNVMIASLNVPQIFEGFQGTMSSRGDKIIFVNLPRDPGLVGITFFVGFFTYAAAIQDVSWPLKQVITS